MIDTIARMLEETRRRFPDRVALIQDDRILTYRDLDRAVNALGQRLRKAGLEKGDHMALMLPNGPEFIIAYFAVLKIGAVAVTLNVLSTPYELLHLLGNSGAKGLITTRVLAAKFDEIKNDLPGVGMLILHDEQSQDQSPFWSGLDCGPDELAQPEIDRNDPAVMIYTSGLTGRPLGAVLTQGNLLHQADLLMTVCKTTEQDRSLSLIPLFHTFGAVVNMLCPIRVGASIVLMDHFSVDGIFTAIERERITYIAAVPRLFIGMIMEAQKRKPDTGSLTLCISGGAAMPPEFFPAFEQKFGIKIMEGYGLTEASPVCTFTRPSMPHKPGSIGTVVPGVAAKVVDDDGREVPTGTVGELAIQGANVMKGYHNDPAATAKVIREGWLHTGDLALIDEEGYIFLRGLKKRMIITSGFNVYPREVEIVLGMHDAVKDSRALGKADLMRGEVVKALVVKKPGAAVEEKELVRHCRKYLSSYKVPRHIEFVDTLP